MNPIDINLQNEAGCVGGDRIKFEWEWLGVLEDGGRYGGDYYALRFGLAEDGPIVLCGRKTFTIFWKRDLDIFNLQPNEVYAWNVAVVRPFDDPPHPKLATQLIKVKSGSLCFVA